MQDDEKPALKLEFAPGCFDSFEGTQEELDELIQEIKRMFESGEFLENSIVLDEEDFSPDMFDEIEEHLLNTPPRRLN